MKRYKLLFILCSILLIYSGCSSSTAQKPPQNHKLSQHYIGAGVEQYFLQHLPDWANYSTSAACFRKFPLKFIDFKKVRTSFNLNYEQVVHFQYMFNKGYLDLLAKYQRDSLPLKEEEKLFFETLDRVVSGLREFMLPKYERVHLIWIDPYLEKNRAADLVKLMKKELMHKGHPVFISLCFNHFQMIQFLKENKLEGKNIRFIPYEMFSIFDPDSKKNPEFLLSIRDIFKKKHGLHLFLPESIQPSEFKGEYTIHNLMKKKK